MRLQNLPPFPKREIVPRDVGGTIKKIEEKTARGRGGDRGAIHIGKPFERMTEGRWTYSTAGASGGRTTGGGGGG